MSDGDLATRKIKKLCLLIVPRFLFGNSGLRDGSIRVQASTCRRRFLRLADANMFLDVRDHAQPVRILVRALRVSGGEERFSKNCDSGVLNTCTYEKLRPVNASESCPAFLSQYAHCG